MRGHSSAPWASPSQPPSLNGGFLWLRIFGPDLGLELFDEIVGTNGGLSSLINPLLQVVQAGDTVAGLRMLNRAMSGSPGPFEFAAFQHANLVSMLIAASIAPSTVVVPTTLAAMRKPKTVAA